MPGRAVGPGIPTRGIVTKKVCIHTKTENLTNPSGQRRECTAQVYWKVLIPTVECVDLKT